MHGTVVSPFDISPGDKIATKFRPSLHHTDQVVVIKSREVKKVSFDTCSAECVHLDHECYDTRFSTIIRVDA